MFRFHQHSEQDRPPELTRFSHFLNSQDLCLSAIGGKEIETRRHPRTTLFNIECDFESLHFAISPSKWPSISVVYTAAQVPRANGATEPRQSFADELASSPEAAERALRSAMAVAAVFMCRHAELFSCPRKQSRSAGSACLAITSKWNAEFKSRVRIRNEQMTCIA
jgi:hypothetical protein